MAEEAGAILLAQCTHLHAQSQESKRAIGERAREALEQKLQHCAALKEHTLQLAEKTKQRETFTRKGGLFALNAQPRLSANEQAEGSFFWIIRCRSFLEALQSEFHELPADRPVVLQPRSLSDIAMLLECGELTTDEQLVNALLVFLTNKLVSGAAASCLAGARQKVLEQFSTP